MGLAAVTATTRCIGMVRPERPPILAGPGLDTLTLAAPPFEVPPGFEVNPHGLFPFLEMLYS